MTRDLRVEIAPNGPDLRLTLYATQPGIPAAGIPFNRQALNLNGPVVDNLRRGEATPAEVLQVTATVSQWLLGNDLTPHVTAALNQPDNEQVRLIFSINDEGLRQSLADTPFELCSLPGGGIPLVLNARNAAIFHLLPKVGASPLSQVAGTWPLRILIVRSNPLDLGGAIPPAVTVRNNIYAALDSRGLNHNLVQIHILSSENAPDVVARPTREAFRSQINKAAYDILVYLGHGDVLTAYQGLPPVNVLQLESDDGQSHITVPADQLAVLLHERPIPVVLVIGCLTGAGIPIAQKPIMDSLIPQWMRGVQGLAQALVNSESGVQLAVGTRYMLDTVDAMLFLNAFFTSLLVSAKPGNVEAAVHAARRDLHFGNPGSYSWSAPMMFRNLESEPVFPFLASPPSAVCSTEDSVQNLRSIFWGHLAKVPWMVRPNTPAAQSMLDTLAALEKQYKQGILQTAPCLMMPAQVEAHSDTQATFAVDLYGALNVDQVLGALIVGGSNVQVTKLEAAPELLASGYDVLSKTKDNQATFSIDRINPAGALQPGPVLIATVQLDSANQVVYPTNLNIQRTVPQQPVCTGSSAVIVPGP
jgi:hypothetical protein